MLYEQKFAHSFICESDSLPSSGLLADCPTMEIMPQLQLALI